MRTTPSAWAPTSFRVHVHHPDPKLREAHLPSRPPTASYPFTPLLFSLPAAAIAGLLSQTSTNRIVLVLTTAPRLPGGSPGQGAVHGAGTPGSLRGGCLG